MGEYIDFSRKNDYNMIFEFKLNLFKYTMSYNIIENISGSSNKCREVLYPHILPKCEKLEKTGISRNLVLVYS